MMTKMEPTGHVYTIDDEIKRNEFMRSLAEAKYTLSTEELPGMFRRFAVLELNPAARVGVLDCSLDPTIR